MRRSSTVKSRNGLHLPCRVVLLEEGGDAVHRGRHHHHHHRRPPHHHHPDVWPVHCSGGVLTAEGGAAHLGTLMTQFAILYALARRLWFIIVTKTKTQYSLCNHVYSCHNSFILLPLATPALWFSAKLTLAQMIKDKKSGTVDMLSCQIRSELPLLRISPMLNFLLYLISRLSSHFYRCQNLKNPTFRVAEWIFNPWASMTTRETEKVTVKLGGETNIVKLS